jgi:hypothetical protein
MTAFAYLRVVGSSQDKTTRWFSAVKAEVIRGALFFLLFVFDARLCMYVHLCVLRWVMRGRGRMICRARRHWCARARGDAVVFEISLFVMVCHSIYIRAIIVVQLFSRKTQASNASKHLQGVATHCLTP